MSARVRGEDDDAQAQDFTDVVVALRYFAAYVPDDDPRGLDGLAWALTRVTCEDAANVIEQLRGN